MGGSGIRQIRHAAVTHAGGGACVRDCCSTRRGPGQRGRGVDGRLCAEIDLLGGGDQSLHPDLGRCDGGGAEEGA